MTMFMVLSPCYRHTFWQFAMAHWTDSNSVPRYHQGSDQANQLGLQVDRPVGCHQLQPPFIIIQFKSWYSFYCQRLEGCIDLVRVCGTCPRLYFIVAVVTQLRWWDSILGLFTRQSSFLTLDHCSLHSSHPLANTSNDSIFTARAMLALQALY